MNGIIKINGITMEKKFKILALLLLLTVLFSTYRCTPGKSGFGKHGNQLDRILFLNDIYQNYDSYLPKDKSSKNVPYLDYFKYGGADRRLLKSVFIRPGTTLTYSIGANTTGANTGKNKNQKIVLEGYLGSVGEKPLRFEISVNGKPMVVKDVSHKVPFFRVEVTPIKGTLTLAVSLSGEKNGMGALGNVCFYRHFSVQERRNVIYYLVDALRADKGGIKGSLFKTDFEGGAIFETAYSNATQTAFSLPALFSGKYTFMLVEKDGDTPFVREEEILLAEYFKSRGYTTAAFINNPWLHKSNSSQGFDIINSCWGYVEKPSAFPSEKDYIDIKYGEMEKYLRQFIRVNKNKPVFIFIHVMEPHVPYEPPLAMRKFSAGADREILETLFEKVTLSPSYPVLDNPGEEQLRVLKALYKDQVSLAFDFFRKIRDSLKEHSILNPFSLLILTSDHGERFFEHGSWIHGPPDIYNEVVRIPIMIKGDGVSGGIYDLNVQLADIYPTIVDWLGDRPVPGLVGKSLLDYTNIGYIKNHDPDHYQFKGRVIYIDGTGKHAHYAYIKDNLKVIINGTKAEVYDLARDPGETESLHGKLEYKKLIGLAKRYRTKFKRSFDAKGKNRGMTAEEKKRLKTLGYIR